MQSRRLRVFYGFRACNGLAWGLAISAALALAAHAELPVETLGRVERLAMPPSADWVWVTDVLLEKASLVDVGAGGRTLGQINTGYGPSQPLYSTRRGEVYLPETYYARKTRGKRSDVVSIYELADLAPVAEIPLPPKRALNQLPSANSALSDDERFLAVFNMTPATSLSIVDLERRRFVGEIETPGCSLVYAAGPRRFFLPCLDGAFLVVTLDERGGPRGKTRTARRFDPSSDPVTEKAVRHGDRWLFVSFAGVVHTIDVSGGELAFPEPWRLADPPDSDRSWRVGGLQHLAVHARSGRLFALMHRGGPDSHKQAGSEVWVFDLESRERVQRIALHTPGLTVMGESLEFGRRWPWPLNRLYDGLLRLAPGPEVDAIAVTQGKRPLLATSSLMVGSLGIYDAGSGDLLRRTLTGNLTSHALVAPFAPLASLGTRAEEGSP